MSEGSEKDRRRDYPEGPPPPLRWRVRTLNPAIDVRRGGMSTPQQTAYVRDRILVQGFPADDDARLGSVISELEKAAAELGWRVEVEPEDHEEARLLRGSDLDAELVADLSAVFGFGLRIEPRPGEAAPPPDAWELLERVGHELGPGVSLS